ncbi:GNAT family N-acetyltransferase [Mycolicibacterium mengxianglii]|uniref:GNAT family N-acetyltransferase n=1 Tax=Mycolicibacterium mengxianglii TaxID=2736649 RepID=UPI0018D0C128|nr:GNAT family N-acetyltransferase [Mycolicibacterium mengxianglii]
MAEPIVQRASDLAALSVFADCFGADLYPLAQQLTPVYAGVGDTLMRQGEPADFFLIIHSGRVEVSHSGDGYSFVTDVGPGRIVGEIALLRHSARTATVTAIEEVIGWSGGDEAFDELIELPGVLAMLIRTARQRLAAFITPIPMELAGGVRLLLRPVMPGDVERTTNSPVEFSSETMYRRFQSPRVPTPSLMRYLFEVDYINHFVWVVTTESGDVVADARFVRDERDASTAEIAFTVGDEYQGRGIGTYLMGALAVAARVAGVKSFSGRVLSDNLAMRKIMDRAGARWEREDLGIVTTVVDVPATLPFDQQTARRIEDVARQVMRAL